MTDAPELLPCPFCGAASEYSTVPDEGQRNDYATVSCTGCGASMRELLHWTEGSGENFPALGAAWNTRALDPRVAALVEAAAPYVSPVQIADYARQMRQYNALVAALAAFKGGEDDSQTS